MKPRIVNECNKQYRLDVVKVVNNIVDRIPDKFLDGLSEIILVDEQGKNSDRIRYIPDGSKKNDSKIEINMGELEYSKYPIYSILALNMDFLLKINEHITRYVKQISTDPEVLSISESKINYSWMYLGIWRPFFILFMILSYPVKKIKILNVAIFKWAKKISS
jgi:hypothetical protein